MKESDEVEELKACIGDLRDENKALEKENDELRLMEIDNETFAKQAYHAGYLSGKEGNPFIRSWLNYRLGIKL